MMWPMIFRSCFNNQEDGKRLGKKLRELVFKKLEHVVPFIELYI